MSDTVDGLVSALDVKSLLDEAQDVGKAWVADNAEEGKDLGKDGLEAVMVMGMIKSFPEEITDPTLNIKKMEASQKLLELAADHEEKLDALEASARAAFGKLFKKAMGRIAGYALKAALIALV
jgi:hypothetical protein